MLCCRALLRVVSVVFVCGFFSFVFGRCVRVALSSSFFVCFPFLFFGADRFLSLLLCSTHPCLDNGWRWSLLKWLSGIESPSVEQGGRRRLDTTRMPVNPYSEVMAGPPRSEREE